MATIFQEMDCVLTSPPPVQSHPGAPSLTSCVHGAKQSRLFIKWIILQAQKQSPRCVIVIHIINALQAKLANEMRSSTARLRHSDLKGMFFMQSQINHHVAQWSLQKESTRAQAGTVRSTESKCHFNFPFSFTC